MVKVEMRLDKFDQIVSVIRYYWLTRLRQVNHLLSKRRI